MILLLFMIVIIALLGGFFGWQLHAVLAKPQPKVMTNEDIALAITCANITNGDAPDIAASHAWMVGVPMFFHFRGKHYGGDFNPYREDYPTSPLADGT